jgi:CheY-like chemotaxis protein
MARVLVVDDSPAIRQALASCLPGFGYDVVVAPDGETGLERSGEAPVDLILLDVDLPRMSGLSVCAALKQDPERRHIPVVMMTGRLTPETVRQARQAGAIAVLGKPFTCDELLAEFTRHLPAGV